LASGPRGPRPGRTIPFRLALTRPRPDLLILWLLILWLLWLAAAAAGLVTAGRPGRPGRASAV
jgi:hypothetical protein